MNTIFSIAMYKITLGLLLLLSAVLNAQFTNVMVNTPSTTDAEEVAIAVNVTNPAYVAAGANISYFFSSSNSGTSWTQKRMNSTLGVWGDPCLLYDHNGYLYFGHLSNPVSGYWIDRIVVQRSTDNGTTWNDGAGIGYRSPKNQDKEWLAVDMHSPLCKGNLYVSWTEFDNYGSTAGTDSSRILFSKSTDKGLSWNTPVLVSDRSGDCVDEDNTVEGAVPTVGPNGEIYISWAGPLGLMFDKSTNGGASFGTDKFISTIPGGWDFAIPGIYRANGLPITLCDTSRLATRGNIYVLWGDQRNGTDNTDVFISRSTDGGNSWSAAMKVNQDNSGRQQFFPWMTIDQTTGFLYVVYYDRRNTTGNATDVYVSRSTDGGLTFQDFKVSNSSFTPSSSVFFGDYTNIAAFNRKIYPIWMRLDNSTLSVYTALITDTTRVVPVELTSFSAVPSENGVRLNWQTASETNCRAFNIQRCSSEQMYLTEGAGKWKTIGTVSGHGTVATVSSYIFEDREVASGEYYYRLQQMDFDGSAHYSDQVNAAVSNSNANLLYQNFPNPASVYTIVAFKLKSEMNTGIEIYNQLGKLVSTKNFGLQSAGKHEINIDISDLSSGVYYYKLLNAGGSELRKMAIVK